MRLTADSAAFVAGLRYAALPPAATGIVASGFIDCIGTIAGGWNEPVGRLAREFAGQRPDAPFALDAFAGPDGGLALAACAHALDFDDTAFGAHPSAVLVPAILAEAAAQGADGRRMIAAYLAGYEVWADLWSREADQHHAKGWHPTAMFGAIAAAAASASLRGLSAETTAHALAIAASFASGIVANFGTMTKPFQVGRAVQSGLLATRLAEAGMDAGADALEHDLGFLRAISPAGRVDLERPSRCGREWAILKYGLNIKLYPVCYAMHRPIDGMIELCRREALPAAAIEQVEVRIGAAQAAMLRNHRPRSGPDAKFSLELGMAAAAIAGRLGRAELADAFVQQPEVQAFFDRVQVQPIAERDPDEPVHSPFDQVVVTTRDGRVLEGPRVSHPVGHFRNPADAESLWRKFSECTAETLAPTAAAGLFAALQNLAELRRLADLQASIMPARIAS